MSITASRPGDVYAEDINSKEEFVDYIQRVKPETKEEGFLTEKNWEEQLESRWNAIMGLSAGLEKYETALKHSDNQELRNAFNELLQELENVASAALQLNEMETEFRSQEIAADGADKEVPSKLKAIMESINGFILDQILPEELAELLQDDKLADQQVHDTPLAELADKDSSAIAKLQKVLNARNMEKLDQGIMRDVNRHS